MAVNYPNKSIPLFIQDVVTATETDVLADLTAYDPTITGITYLFGNAKETFKQLQEIWQNTASGNSEIPYPCIILNEDIIIDRRNTGGFFGTPILNIIIATRTLPEFSSAQRETKTFEPILRPIYYEFLNQLKKNKYTSIYSPRNIDHRYIERKYWGKDEGTETKLNTYIDAIELTDLQFKLQWEWCTTIVNGDL